MNFDIRSYVKVFKIFNDDETKIILDSISNADWQKHNYSNAFGKVTTYDDDLYVTNIISDVSNFVMEKIYHSLFLYVNSIQEMNNCFSHSWNGYSFVRFNRYQEGQNMKIHCDHIHSLFPGEPKGVPIYTVLGFLNSDYEGGDFVLWEDTVMNPEPGSIMVFPSNFLYPHRVETITKGTRYSFVSWAY